MFNDKMNYNEHGYVEGYQNAVVKVRILSELLLSGYPQELESCSLKLHQSSASRGVRSRQQQEADLFAPVKVETIPLLSPTMEAELMREPWTFQREPASCVVTPRVAAQNVEEEAVTTPFSSWEENFQDLSGWCMANIQARCDFPIGESANAAKLTGTRNEGSKVLTTAEGVPRGLMKAIEKKIYSGVDTMGARRPEPATCVVPPQIDHAYPLAGQQQQQIYFNNNNTNSITGKMITSDESNLKNSGNVWMGLSAKVKPTIATTDNNSAAIAWQELSELGITAAATSLPLYQHQGAVTDLETKLQQQELQQPEQQRDDQDVFPTLENDASNGFDLLSYLCEDDIPSPGDSVSTDSSRITEVNSLPRLSSNSSAHIAVSPRTYEPITLSTSTPTDTIKSRLQAADSPYSRESSKLSPISTALSDVRIPTRSSYRQLRTSIVKIEKPESPPPIVERRSTRPKRTRTDSNASQSSSSRGRGRKRILNDVSDSDDETYRETREKNNEASRKSRMNKKAKEMEMAKRAVELEKDNRILKMKVEELEKLVSSMRNALLRSALKREVKTNMF